MKKNAYLIFSLIVFLFFSCGSGEEKKSDEKDAKSESSSKIYKSENGVLEIELESDWSVNKYSAGSPDGHALFAYTMESSGNLYEDIVDDYSEALDDIKEVQVDGVPAVTVKSKYQKNGDIIGRIWLIYNGTVVMNFTIEAVEEVFNDDFANELIKKVKITERLDNIVLPEGAQKAKYEKPANFPDDMASTLSDLFSEQSVLNDEILEKASASLMALKEFGKNLGAVDTENPVEVAVLDSIVSANGLENWEQLRNIMSVSFASVGAVIPAMHEMQAMDQGSIDYTATMDMVKSTISTYNLSLDDQKYCFDNWDQVSAFLAEIEEK